MEFSDPTPTKVLQLQVFLLRMERHKGSRSSSPPSLPDPWRACALCKLIMNSGCSSQEAFPCHKTCDSAQFLSLHFVGQTWNNTSFSPKIKKTRNNISGIQENPASNTSPSLARVGKADSRYPSHGHCPRGSRALSSLAWTPPGWGSLCQASPASQGRIFG